jgi:hypothetical protein
LCRKAVLREQARDRFDALLTTADKDTLLMLTARLIRQAG